VKTSIGRKEHTKGVPSDHHERRQLHCGARDVIVMFLLQSTTAPFERYSCVAMADVCAIIQHTGCNITSVRYYPRVQLKIACILKILAISGCTLGTRESPKTSRIFGGGPWSFGLFDSWMIYCGCLVLYWFRLVACNKSGWSSTLRARRTAKTIVPNHPIFGKTVFGIQHRGQFVPDACVLRWTQESGTNRSQLQFYLGYLIAAKTSLFIS